MFNDFQEEDFGNTLLKNPLTQNYIKVKIRFKKIKRS